MPRISASLIVKNEEYFLGGCLASIAPIVDEIVVVDTGSTDRTVELARQYGARCLAFAWNGRFDDARNFSVDQCTGDWVLYIDADERVRPLDRARLDAELADPDAIACRTPFIARAGYTPYLEWRLFRRHPQVRFVGAIHETLMPSISELIAAGPWVARVASLTIEHLGYDGDIGDKHRRNLPLLERAIGENPERLYLWTELARTRLGLADDAGALQAWGRALALAREEREARSLCAVAFIDASTYRLDHGLPLNGLVDEARARFPQDPHVLWLAGRQAVIEHRHDQAITLFRALLAVDASVVDETTGYDMRLFGLFPFEGIAGSLFALGRYPESVAYFEKAVSAAPERIDLTTRLAIARQRSA